MLVNDSAFDLSSNFRLSCNDFDDSVSSKSVDSLSLKSIASQPPLLSDAELAERARVREAAAKAADGHLREAPSVADANAALKDIGMVLRPPTRFWLGDISPALIRDGQ
jgi:hypothetical protein